MPLYPEYTVELKDNLLAGIELERFAEDYRRGAGRELEWTIRSDGGHEPPKMHAAYSSAALVVNTFTPWKHEASRLVLPGGTHFTDLRFEVACPTGLAGTPPHLDVLAIGENGQTVLGVESKCLEFLTPHRAVFASSYQAFAGLTATRPYFDLLELIKCDPARYVHLNAGQLIKHAFGLAATFPGKRLVLLYLFWEPEDGESYGAFSRHREELVHFSESVAGAAIQFEWTSYPELWKLWEALDEPSWIGAHTAALRERYGLTLNRGIPNT